MRAATQPEQNCAPHVRVLGLYNAPMTRKRLKGSGANADNVQVSAKSQKRSKDRPGTALRRDNRPDSMDYVQSRDRKAPASPNVDGVVNSGQRPRSRKGAHNVAESHESPDLTVKNLYAVRREIHNRLGRIEAMEGRLATAKMVLAELEVRERELVFDLWAQSPLKLVQTNESTRRWRRRKETSK